MKRELSDIQAMTGPWEVNQSVLHVVHRFGAFNLLRAMVQCVMGKSAACCIGLQLGTMFKPTSSSCHVYRIRSRSLPVFYLSY